MLIDLQLHSTYSDGYLSPTAVAEFVFRQGVKIASLTDHNTVGGQDEFRIACKRLGMKSITGLEIYAKMHHYRFNILWYNFNENSPELHNLLRLSQERRRRQMRQALETIVRRGLKLDVNKILDKYNHYTPLNHIVDDIWAVSSNRIKIKRQLDLARPREGDIMHEYFHNKEFKVLKNAYIDIDKIMEIKKKIGGKIILCHPAKGGYVGRIFLQDLKAVGVSGLELLSPHHSYGATMHLQQLAQELGWIETGGSDFHRFEENRQPIQYSWQYYKVNSELLKGVEKIID